MKKISFFIILFLLVIIILPSTLAHVPKASGDNDHIEHALHIDDPLKSWAIYDEITDPGEVRYYSFDLKAGDRLKISVFTPDDTAFSPNLIIMTPTGEEFNASELFFELPQQHRVQC